MLKSDFQQEGDINVFFTGEKYRIYADTNLRVFTNLEEVRTEPILTTGFWEPLHFFNVLHEQISIMLHHRNKPLEVLHHLRNLSLNQLELYFLLSQIYEFIVFKVPKPSQGAPDVITDHGLEVCRALIGQEIDRVQSNIAKANGNSNAAGFIFLYEHVLPVLNVLPTPQEKIEYLIDRIAFCKQEITQSPASFVNNGEVFIKRCELEIERIKRLQQEGFYNTPQTNEPSKPKKPEQVTLGLYYHYRQATGEFPDFSKMEGGIKKSVWREAAKWSVSGKNLYDAHRSVNRRADRLVKGRYKNIKTVIGMLEEYPKALALAKDELKTLESMLS